MSASHSSATENVRQLFMRLDHLERLPRAPRFAGGFRLRRAAPSDEGELARVLAAAFEDEEWTPETVHARLTGEASVKAVYVAARGRSIGATASARYLPDRYPGLGYLHWVGTHPDYRGRGLGRMVTLAALNHFRRSGCTGAVLETDDHRIAAIRLYLSLGFVPQLIEPDHLRRWEVVLQSIGLGETGLDAILR
ncbi:MAG: GNAT family N-acetyltransferase [Chthonomonadales bacterium]